LAIIAGIANAKIVLSSPCNFGDVWQFWQSSISSHPIPRSAADSSGVPQTRQITAEQSPQVSGSVTGRAQLGQ
jgi:hypothetical protein